MSLEQITLQKEMLETIISGLRDGEVPFTKFNLRLKAHDMSPPDGDYKRFDPTYVRECTERGVVPYLNVTNYFDPQTGDFVLGGLPNIGHAGLSLPELLHRLDLLEDEQPEMKQRIYGLLGTGEPATVGIPNVIEISTEIHTPEDMTPALDSLSGQISYYFNSLEGKKPCYHLRTGIVLFGIPEPNHNGQDGPMLLIHSSGVTQANSTTSRQVNQKITNLMQRLSRYSEPREYQDER